MRARVAPLGADHVLLLVEDRSKAARVEEIRRDFLANVSHELKTPVGGIALLAEAILDAHDDPEAVARFIQARDKPPSGGFFVFGVSRQRQAALRTRIRSAGAASCSVSRWWFRRARQRCT